MRVSRFALCSLGVATALRPQTSRGSTSRSWHVQRARALVIQKGWAEQMDQASGDIFYYNDETGESSWDPPPGFQVGGAAPPGAMPGGWVALVDEASGETFYVNEQTGQSQWEPPQQAAVAARPRQHDVYDPRSVTQSYDQYLAEPPAAGQ